MKAAFANRIRIAAVVLLAPALLAQSLLEYRVKAACLLNFTKFVEWPAGRFTDPAAPITMCIVGEDPFGRVLDQTLEGETVGGRRFVLQRLQRGPATGCHVLFVSPNEKDIPGILASTGSGVLTVGEGDAFMRAGGMISFVLENHHVRFDINQSAAREKQLQLSSRLLALARNVRQQAGGGF